MKFRETLAIISGMKRKIGALFDWDGVIADSGAAHEASWIKLARANGLTLPEGFFNATFGRRNQEAIAKAFRWTSDPKEVQRLSDQKEEIYRSTIAQNGLPTIHGAAEFVRALKSAGIPCAVGSSTPRENIEQALELLGMENDFDALITSEDVERGKPAPDVYVKAAERIGLDPRDCAVFEDSLAGIVAAARAGAKKIALSTTNPENFWKTREIPEERPDLVMPDFSGFSPENLLKIFDA